MNKGDAITLIKKDLNDLGLKNYFLQTGILSVINKESKFIPRVESSYSKTSNERLRSIFKKVRTLPEQQLTKLKADDKNFYNFVYGGKYGNTDPEDAYNYRGRGLNQLTFKNLYKHYGDKIGIDLVKFPEQANQPDTASKISAHFFNEGLSSGLKSGAFKQYNVEKLEDIDSIDKGLLVAYQINAGLQTNLKTPFFEESIALAKKNIKEFIDIASENKGKSGLIVGVLLAVAFFFVINKN